MDYLTDKAAAVYSVCLFTLASGTLIYSSWFLKIELGLHGLQKLLRNKFVMLSVGLGISSIISAYCDASLNMSLSHSASLKGFSAIIFWSNSFLTLSFELHIYLLFLRTMVVLHSSSKASKFFLKLFVFIFLLLGLSFFAALFTLRYIPTISLSTYHNLVYICNIMAYTINYLYVFLDCFSAIVFAWHMYKQKKALKSALVRKQNQPTEIIAITGILIAVISIITVTLSAFVFSGLGSPSMCVEAILWISMKLHLEKLNDSKNEEYYDTALKAPSPKEEAKKENQIEMTLLEPGEAEDERYQHALQQTTSTLSEFPEPKRRFLCFP
jgi:hypothetical protein